MLCDTSIQKDVTEGGWGLKISDDAIYERPHSAYTIFIYFIIY